MASVSELFQAAVAYHQVGRWQEADRAYQQVLAADPVHAGAWHLRGVLAWQVGDYSAAIPYIGRALDLAPAYVDAHNNLGLIFEKQAQLTQAEVCFRRAIELNPNFVAAYGNLGNTLAKLGKWQEAIANYRRAAELNPQSDAAHYNLATALQTTGARREAIESYRRAIDLNPRHAEACNNLAVLLMDRVVPGEAVALLRQAIASRSDHVEAHNNLATLLANLDQLDEALSLLDRAIELKSDYAEGHATRGNILKAQGNLDDAITCYRRAIEFKPVLADAHCNLAGVLGEFGQHEEAIAAYRRAIALNPDASLAHSSFLYAIYFCPGYDSQAIFEEHRQWNERHAAPLATLIQPHRNEPNPERRLRIGYVSPDFRDHCQSFFTTPLLSNHNHSQFEIFCYSNVRRPDEITARLRSLANFWREVAGQSPQQVADQIRGDRIDILVDLTMHMAKGVPLLFARKPAPVQVCWLAYPGTTGLTTIDYRFTDPYLDPPGLFDRYYSEQSVRLPHAFWCYDPLSPEPPVSDLPASDTGYITFGCLNNFRKVNDSVLRLWTKVMNAVDRSRLILMAPPGSARTHVLTVFAQEHISADRISFVPFQARPDYLTTYHRFDLGLETLPCPGHTTSLDSLWMGVPVPTIAGQTAIGRAGISLLENLGLPELIAYTPEEYVQIVSRLAHDIPRLKDLRESLRHRMQVSPLMNAPQFAKDIEIAYRRIWRRWCDTQTTIIR